MTARDLTHVGKYKIVELCGEGAMGIVYRALDPVLDRGVAIKVMTEALAREPELRDRFLREAQAAGSLQHPNVITVYDFGEVDGHLYIAMEFVEGVDLEQIILRRDPLTLQQKLDIAIDILAGLSYAHKRGVVHRDIKPANIRITEDGRAKIMDFGIAHLQSSNLTGTGVMLGTPNYMAPEQVTGQKATPATDLFAFGAVLYELLTGSRPFQGPTLHTILFKIVSEDPPPPISLLPGLPPMLDHIVRKALAKDPKDRFASALEMANELSVVRGQLSGHPRADTVSLRASIETSVAQLHRTRTRRMVRAAAFGGAAVGVGLLAAVGWFGRASERGARGASATSAAAPALHLDTTPSIATSPATPPAATVPAATPDTATVAATPPAPLPAPAAAPAHPADGARALALVRSLQRSALQARERAADVGASTAQLAPGDRRYATVEQLIDDGRLDEAGRRLNQASALWIDAERAARLASASNAARATISPPPASSTVAVTRDAPPSAPITPPAESAHVVPVAPPPAPVAPPASASSVATSSAPPPSAAPASSTAAEASPRAPAEIRDAIAAYARAISARDVGAMRRLYPTMPSTQQSGFEDFFRSVRTLAATLTVADLSVNGASADARVTGIYDFVGSDGRAAHQPVSFRASLRREGGAWRLVEVR